MDDKKFKRNRHLADVIAWSMIGMGTLFIQFAVIWQLSGDTSGKWFQRMALGVICFGFSGIILKLTTKDDK